MRGTQIPEELYSIIKRAAGPETPRKPGVSAPPTTVLYANESIGRHPLPAPQGYTRYKSFTSAKGGNTFPNVYVRELPSRAEDGASIENILSFSKYFNGKRGWTPLMRSKYLQNLVMKANERSKNWEATTGTTDNDNWGSTPPKTPIEKLQYKATLPYVLPGGRAEFDQNERKHTLHLPTTEGVLPASNLDAPTTVGLSSEPSGNTLSAVPMKPGETLAAWLRRAATDSTTMHERGHSASFPYLYRNTVENNLLKIHKGLSKLIPGYFQDDEAATNPRASGYMFYNLAEALRAFRVYKDAMIADPRIPSMPDKLIGASTGNWAVRWAQQAKIPEQLHDGDAVGVRIPVIQAYANQYWRDVKAGRRSRDVEIEEAIRQLNSLYRGARRRSGSAPNLGHV